MKKKGKIIDAIFCSVWNNGDIVLQTNCKVDLNSKKVFSIEQADDNITEALDSLDYESIIIDGEEYDVFPEDEAEAYDFWYRH